jgi:hypothetical protein
MLAGTCQGDFFCQFTLPFTIRFGATKTDQIFAYGTGIVTFAAPLPADFPSQTSLVGENGQVGLDYFRDSGINALVPALLPLFPAGRVIAGTVTSAQVRSLAEAKIQFCDQPSFQCPSGFAPGDQVTEPILDAFIALNRFDQYVGQTTVRVGSGYVVFDIPGADTVRAALWQGGFNYFDFDSLVFIGRSSELPQEFGMGAFSFMESLEDRSEYQFEIVSSPNAVPEPASWALMVAGFGVAGAAARRSRRVARLA